MMAKKKTAPVTSKPNLELPIPPEPAQGWAMFLYEKRDDGSWSVKSERITRDEWASAMNNAHELGKLKGRVERMEFIAKKPGIVTRLSDIKEQLCSLGEYEIAAELRDVTEKIGKLV